MSKALLIELLFVGCGLGFGGCGLGVVGCGLGVVGCGLWVVGCGLLNILTILMMVGIFITNFC